MRAPAALLHEAEQSRLDQLSARILEAPWPPTGVGRLLKNLGLVIGQAKMNVFAVRATELAEARPELAAAVEPLLKAREAVGQQIADLEGHAASTQCCSSSTVYDSTGRRSSAT
jgi:hypothetical protein